MIAAAASELWRSATALLTTARPSTVNFKPPETPKSPTAAPNEAGAPAHQRDKRLADLQSWIAGQQTPPAHPVGIAQALAAYGGYKVDPAPR